MFRFSRNLLSVLQSSTFANSVWASLEVRFIWYDSAKSHRGAITDGDGLMIKDGPRALEGCKFIPNFSDGNFEILSSIWHLLQMNYPCT